MPTYVRLRTNIEVLCFERRLAKSEIQHIYSPVVKIHQDASGEEGSLSFHA